MRTCLARRRHRVQRARFQKHPAQLAERAETRHGHRDLTHDRASDGIEDPLRQQHAYSASVLDQRAAEEIPLAMRLDGEFAPVKWVPGVAHDADIVSPRIMT